MLRAALVWTLLSTSLYGCDPLCDDTIMGDHPAPALPHGQSPNDFTSTLSRPRSVNAAWSTFDASSSTQPYSSVRASGEEVLSVWLEVDPKYHVTGKAHFGDECDYKATAKAILHLTSESGRIDEAVHGTVNVDPYGKSQFSGTEAALHGGVSAPQGGNGKVYFEAEFDTLRDEEMPVVQISVRASGHAAYLFLST